MKNLFRMFVDQILESVMKNNQISDVVRMQESFRNRTRHERRQRQQVRFCRQSYLS